MSKLKSMRKNIVIAACGNKFTYFKDLWLKYPEERNFDICVVFHNDHIEQPELYESVDYFYHLKGFKCRMIHQVITEFNPEFLEHYEYFYLLDDDLEIDTIAINKMFGIAKALDLWICQAALSEDSIVSWPILKYNADCFLRFLGQVEVMGPLFNNHALKKCLPTFTASNSNWGMDTVWSKILGDPVDKIAVIDAIQMRHAVRPGSGELYQRIDNSPKEDFKKIGEEYGVSGHKFTELGRFLIVNNQKNKIIRALNILNDKAIKLKQGYNDLGIPWRIKNRLGLLKS